MKKIFGDYPYAISYTDIDFNPDERLTPEEVARAESMHPQINYPANKNNKWKSLRGNKNAQKNPEKRTPKQQETYEKNIKYRTRYQEKRARKKLIELNESFKRINPNTDPILYAKILRNIKKNKDRIEELLIIKEKYDK